MTTIIQLPPRVALTPAERGILGALSAADGKAVSLEKLAQSYPGREWRQNDRTIRVWIHYLRKKLAPAGWTIRCVVERGYYLERSEAA